jgi:RNA polymerase sigma-70 factor (ECF subfamily)
MNCAEGETLMPMGDADALPPRRAVAPPPLLPEAGLAARKAAVNLKELTQAIRGGDERAFTSFYELYSLRLYKYLLVLTKGNEAEAREVLQTVVIKLAKRFEVFEEERRFWGWLCRVARNAFLDSCRGHRREQRWVPFEDLGRELADTEPEGSRLVEALDAALEQLAPEERELLRAAYGDGRPLRELADESDLSYKAVESRLGRLRQKLKTHLLHILRHEDHT